MKKILFVIYGLGIGGIEKCLVNLVNQLNKDKYSITIAVMNPEYEFLDQIDATVKIIPFEGHFLNTTDTIRYLKKAIKGYRLIPKLLHYFLYRLAVRLHFFPWKLQKWIDEEYDFAIAYTHVGFVPNYVIDRTRAKTKVLWYHTLYIDKKNYPYYKKFDKVVAVSEYCKNNFVNSFPLIKDRVNVLYNYYNFLEIKTKAHENIIDMNEDVEKVVTVGRLSPEKGFELAIRAAAILKEKSKGKIHWYWIGDGPECFKVQASKLINDLCVESNFHLLGSRINPYPYIYNCDIYVQPSEREAFSTTIIEAKSLNKPIVVTDIGSVYEQLENGINAFIVSHSPESLAEKILLLYENQEIKDIFKENSQRNMDWVLSQKKSYESFFD